MHLRTFLIDLCSYDQRIRGITVLKSNKSLYTITLVFLIVQIMIMIGLVHINRYDHLRSVVITTSLWIIYTLLELKYQFKMNTYIRVLMVLSIFFDAYFGIFLDLYSSSFIFDKALHIFGSYSFSLFTYILVMQLQANLIDKKIKFILVICLGLSLGAIYEISEFLTDTFSHPSPPSQPSLLDTDLDLIGNLTGSLLAGFHVISRNFVNEKF